MEMGDLFLSKWAYRIIRWVFVLVFMYAGIIKLVDPDSFAVLIGSYGLVPESWVVPLAIGLPAFEVLAAGGLLFEVRGSLALVSGLLLLFICILGYGIWMGLDIDCGCFGPGDPEAEAFSGLRQALFKDFVMLAGIFYLYYWRFKQSFKPVGIGSLINNRLK
jgi:hypothetical protein